MAQSDFEQESTANATWSRMLQGNRRFAEGKPDHPWQDKETRQTLLDGQNPDAAVLSCSDSRVPPEIIFDQGLGDLFTVRTAGQLIDSAVIASLEYAVKKLHVSLICVLGHEHCGAIEAAEQELDDFRSRRLTGGRGCDGRPRRAHRRRRIDYSAPGRHVRLAGARSRARRA